MSVSAVLGKRVFHEVLNIFTIVNFSPALFGRRVLRAVYSWTLPVIAHIAANSVDFCWNKYSRHVPMYSSQM